MANFSFHRFVSVARFFFPRLKLQIIWYPIISLILGAATMVCVLSQSPELFLLALTGDTFILSILLEYGPLAFAFYSSPEMETSLPATNAEKTIFIFGYTFIAIPIMLWAPVTLIELAWCDKFFTPTMSEIIKNINSVVGALSYKNIIMSMFQYLFPMAVCLYAVMKHTRKRLAKGIIWTVCANVSLAVIGVLIGAGEAFAEGYNDARMGKDPRPDEITHEVLSEMGTFINWTGVILAICSIFVIYKTYRAITSRQI